MDSQYSFRIPVETLAALRQIAEDQDLSVAQVIRRALKAYAEAQKNAKA